jgi:serine/threonine protein kinase/Tol biopolymer transport system component
MTEARWEQVKALFQATLDRPPVERAAFLAAAAGGDEALRREVETLLRSASSEVDFTDRLPLAGASSLLDSLAVASPSHDPTRSVTLFTADVNIGPYRVIAPLGAGGMGEVFRARDSKLNRDVALKVLPSAFEFDPDRLARFRREAQVLAALNHPHIAAIYGLEESNGRQALVLELVEGATLADRIADGPLPLAEALRIGRQIADALHAAHDKGIVHRDLKPANIKVTPAGVVKVLDFGLAKTAAVDVRLSGMSQAPTVADGTRLGVILGTAAYMSPEQARGLDVDPRTDIWAFGCVLFEMLTGRKAFAADARSDSIAKILEGEPDWTALPRSTPAKIQQLLRQCLQKDASRRPQSIAQARSVIEQLIARGSLSARAWMAIGTAAMVAISMGAFVWSRVDRRPLASRTDWVQLTKLDSVTQPALSPDGRMLAFIRGINTFVSPGQLYVKLLPDGEPVALTHDNLSKMGPVFSPDGSRIAYTVNDGSWDTWQVPALRGEPRRWLRNASGLTWIGANDLLFSEIKEGSHMVIVRSGEGRADARDLYVPPNDVGMAHRSYASPDRKSVLVVEMDQTIWSPCRLVPIDGSSSRPIGPPKARCTNAAWSTDGRWMYFSADAGDGFHVWRQRFPNGPAEQVTSGPTEEEGLAVTPDGNALITSVGLTQRTVWLHDAAGERQISLEGYAYWPILSADARKICFRVTSGVGSGQSPSELWVQELDSGSKQRLFPGQLVTSYDLSRDDRVVAAVVDGSGRNALWLAWLDGREAPRPIPHGEGDNPRFGRDGEIVFRAFDGKPGFLYRMQENGDERTTVANVRSATIGMVSPDGKWVSAMDSGMLLYPTNGQAPIPIAPSLRNSRMRWSRDGKYAYLSIQDGQSSAFGLGHTYVMPLAKGSALPSVPPGGFRTEGEIATLPGVENIPYGDVAPGPSRSVYAFSRMTTTRNLYRIPLR